MPTSASLARALPRASSFACSFAFAISGLPCSAQAQTTGARLGETVVTATRTPTRTDELLSDVVVIQREQLDQFASRTLPEVLARLAGVQVSATGGRGKSSSVFIRGAEARHTVLLIDGVRYGSATLGTPAWENIPLEMVERIEVLKGPASALYGSEGVGGVVQLFMRKARPGDPVFSPRATVELGSDSYRRAAAGFSGASGGLSYSLDVQNVRDKSFSSTNPRAQFGNYNADRDPFEQDSLNLALGYQLSTDWKLEAGLLRADGENHYDDGPGRDTYGVVRTRTGYVGVRGQLTSNWSTQLRFSQGVDFTRARIAATGSVPGLFETSQDQYQWQNDIVTPLGTVVAGLERREQRVESDTRYDVRERSIDAAFVGLNGSAGDHSWQLNARRDRNSQFGGSNTWFAAYGYRISPNWRINASHGTSFVAPSFNQLYYPNFGNTELQPEEGRNSEIGIAWTEGAHTVKLVAFDNKIRGFITNTVRPENIPRARIEGWTLGYDGSFGALSVHASYDKLDPRNELTGKMLARRANDQVGLSADYSAGAWKFGASMLHVGRRFDDTANTARLRLGNYTTVDLFAEYRFRPDWTVQARIENLNDARYETAYGYNQRGRAGYVALKWQPGR